MHAHRLNFSHCLGWGLSASSCCRQRAPHHTSWALKHCWGGGNAQLVGGTALLALLALLGGSCLHHAQNPAGSVSGEREAVCWWWDLLSVQVGHGSQSCMRGISAKPALKQLRSPPRWGMFSVQPVLLPVKLMWAALWKILLSSCLLCSWLIQDFSVPSPLIFTSTSAYWKIFFKTT